MATDDFYDRLSPVYDLIFEDWDQSMERQGAALDRIVRAETAGTAHTVLDVACGIGTQSIALAGLGYRVTASDLSGVAVERARREAKQRGLQIDFHVADMTALTAVHRGAWDVVIACDNSVPHLQTDEEIETAFREMWKVTRPGGVVLITVRDYASLPEEHLQLRPYGVRERNGVRFTLFQVWESRPPGYQINFFWIREAPGEAPELNVVRSIYYAVTIETLVRLLSAAGYERVRCLRDGEFYQPVLMGRRPAAR